MWSVNTRPNPGDSSIATRACSSTRRSDVIRSNLISGALLPSIADPPSCGLRPIATVRSGAVPADGPHFYLDH